MAPLVQNKSDDGVSTEPVEIVSEANDQLSRLDKNADVGVLGVMEMVGHQGDISGVVVTLFGRI
eukprot:4254289-Ditylum_brightwellii.AAC.1